MKQFLSFLLCCTLTLSSPVLAAENSEADLSVSGAERSSDGGVQPELWSTKKTHMQIGIPQVSQKS